MERIGVMGAAGSFSEQAGQMYITTEAQTEAILVPLISADGVLGALQRNEIERGIIPVMNNNGGIVEEAMHAMAKYTFVIQGFFSMDVHHMLLVKPGTTKETITMIMSHDQALKQCAKYLDLEWAHAEIMPYKDTAQAAADLATGVLSPTTAVIAPRRAAELYGLEILAESIQDNIHNKTTFMVVKSK